MNRRYKELDALRGIAALTVVFNHFMIIIPNVPQVISNSPLKIFWAGHEAVIFFFVLSGFVLSLQFYSSNKEHYISFIIKRICRVYMPYLIAIIIAIVFFQLYQSVKVNGLSMWYMHTWNDPLSINLFLNHIILITDFKNTAFDPVIWSLVHEMRISLVFPLLMMIILKFSWKIVMVIGSFLALSGAFFDYTAYHFLHRSFDYFDTLCYISCFFIGALIAKHKEDIKEFSKISTFKKIIILLVGFLMYIYSGTIDSLFKYFHHGHFISFIITTWIITGGVAIFIIFTLVQTNIKSFFNKTLFQFLGKISYSLYLYHAVILIVIFRLYFGKLSLILLYLISFSLSLIVAFLCYYIIEKPFILLGRLLVYRVQKMKNKQILMLQSNHELKDASIPH